MEWSAFGEKFTRESGIALLMKDLAEGVRSGALMMGGGNPGQIPEFKAEMKALASDALSREGAGGLVEAISKYDGPRGNTAFVDALVPFLRSEMGWDLSQENVVLTNGSQASIFYIFNLLCGVPQPGAKRKKVLLPVCPEYLGYADVGITDDLFVTARPRIEVSEDDRSFKYRLDMESVRAAIQGAGGSGAIGLICISRPTNPTGNVLTNSEVEALQGLARECGAPLVVDGAYGLPFPRILFAEDIKMPHFSEDSGLIVCFSLSKLGLPGARTGIVVAPKAVAAAMMNLNGVLSLAPGGVGSALALPLITQEGRMARLCEETVRPWYKHRAMLAKDAFIDALGDEPRVLCHRPEGGIFLWVWCRDLPVTSDEMYRRLKASGVLVIPGHFFFPGLAGAGSWRHTQECLRVSYAAIDDEATLIRGLHMVAAAIRTAYREVVSESCKRVADAPAPAKVARTAAVP